MSIQRQRNIVNEKDYEKEKKKHLKILEETWERGKEHPEFEKT